MRGGSNRWLVLMVGIFGAFASILDSTIVNTAIPKMQSVFGADLHQASYISTGYTLAQGVVVSASGFLANRYGIKRIYLLSLTLFTIGSALCGLAWSINTLIFFRILQGAGGAALFPLTFSLIMGAFGPEERGLANGVFGIPVLFAPAIGPTLGGYLVQNIDWRIIFYVNLPIGILGVTLGLRFLREGPTQPNLPFDLRGFLIIAGGLFMLLFGLSNLSYDGWRSVSTVSGPILVGCALLATFIPIQLSTAQPLLNLRLFTRRNFLVGNLIIWLATVGLFAPSFLLPQYLQNLRGLDPFPAGLLLFPNGLAAMVGTIMSGALYNRLGPKVLIMVGAAVTALDSFFIGQWSTLTSMLTWLLPLLLVRGFCLPWLAQTPSNVALQGITGSALPGATTLTTVSRSVVASMSIAVLSNVLQTKRLSHQSALAAGVYPGNATAMRVYNQLVALFTHSGHSLAVSKAMAIAQLSRLVSQQALALAYQDVYLIVGVLALMPLVLVPFLRIQPFTSGRAAAPAPAE